MIIILFDHLSLCWWKPVPHLCRLLKYAGLGWHVLFEVRYPVHARQVVEASAAHSRPQSGSVRVHMSK
eukprot:864507-Amphidinium_carterae.1